MVNKEIYKQLAEKYNVAIEVIEEAEKSIFQGVTQIMRDHEGKEIHIRNFGLFLLDKKQLRKNALMLKEKKRLLNQRLADGKIEWLEYLQRYNYWQAKENKSIRVHSFLEKRKNRQPYERGL